MNVTIPTYKSVLEGDESVAAAEVEGNLLVSQKRTEQSISTLELELLERQQILQQVVGRKSIDITAILNAKRQVALAENAVEEAKAIFSALFPVEETS